ncbi:MAG: type II toxin-antitoxin system HipA family toxin [Desulfovermiculus sp.]|nr:type II toxin-antitoxin system HipA family toxin [Desulfovermiculus sp.]
MSKEIFVFIDLSGVQHFVGSLWIHERQGVQRSSFRYTSTWLASPQALAIEPSLPLGQGTYHTDKPLFGSMGDAAPDRWGRMLMERMEAREARKENRKARKLGEDDYLLMVDDQTRQGALRFASHPAGPFLASYPSARIPPFVELGRLLDSSSRIINQEEKDQDLRDILEPGSSLGGARPKASVVDQESSLWIAKFPSPKDEWDVELWEYISLKLARKAGIPVPAFQLQNISGQHVLLTNRFDRQAKVRVPFVSAMTMLDAQDREQRSYLEIAEVLVSCGAAAKTDLKDLWRRMVFNVLVSNLDDHLRNHGFLFDHRHTGWRLSPTYDLEPLPEQIKGRFLQTSIDLDNNMASLELAFEVAEEFGLPAKEARKVAGEIGKATETWKNEASSMGVGKREMDFMASAFEHDNLCIALGRKSCGR